MSDREREFMTKSEFHEYRMASEKALSLQKERDDKREGRGAGLSQGWGILLGLVGALGTIAAIYFASRGKP
jgi:hypothetical protein